MSYTPFVATSPRAIAGIGFQNKVFNEISDLYPEIDFEMTWDYFKSQNPELTDKELAILEKSNGDITYVFNGQRHYIECCFAMGSNVSRLCEMKRKNFIGKNKWYCYGFANIESIVFIPSSVWQKYTSFIEPADRSCRMVPIKSILNLRNSSTGIENYMSSVHETQA